MKRKFSNDLSQVVYWLILARILKYNYIFIKAKLLNQVLYEF